ncbi:penicillin-binding protein 1A [Ectothiorhodospira lacustris]|uniref:penicillin-binding protein 1A n=1 Tax=Ectothiorhodospira lacustris TaxID=2899127 RepID=UPI001EE7FF69|nr:penicillin-binding protein 1A [Ectothiorhodospira lacustris]MCG5501890.1 penicillin-binding protein 1A [Ectothiorhodospira lacustris]MCG5509833.1 penicillin-binding protein 1A [Ectothiorhodospira lacustris]MCG5521086.1 penicillin-binding protein 1A [Ectothiorhodospira lacustris]
MRFLIKSLVLGLMAVFGVFTLGVLFTAAAYAYLAPQMPDVESLREVQLQVPLRVYSRDGLLMAEYGEQRREPIAIDDVPELMRLAFLAAEDDRFETHPGVDHVGLIRAAVNLLTTGEKTQGGSTITMQVARNFFLEREKTYTRKLTEIFLAIRIERELSKDEILELYLNKIFLGQRAYGVRAAAQVYYGVDVDALTLAQIATIAGLPQAPSRANPVTNPARAVARRNYVLGRMHELGYIDTAAFEAARQAPETARLHNPVVQVDAAHVAEMVRMDMVARFGDAAYTDGYRVYTSLDPAMQGAATRALRKGLMEYDLRHGYRGPEAEIDLRRHETDAALDRVLADYPRVAGQLWPGVVVEANAERATVYVGRGQRVTLNRAAVEWARPYVNESTRGPAPRGVSDVVRPGHVVRLLRESEDRWVLRQVPAVEGALVALDARDGALLALVGGYDFYRSNFNRAVRAERQPGSAFKPFIYSAALGHGFSPASVINDAPIVIDDVSLQGEWRPRNYSGRFYGPTRLREALAHSRNLVSIRLLDEVGVNRVHGYLGRFGLDPARHPRSLSMALGSGSVTPLELTRAYGVFANGGYRVEPWFIDRVEDAAGVVVLRSVPRRVCESPCRAPTLPDDQVAKLGMDGLTWPSGDGPAFLAAERAIPASNAYQMYSMMRDVVQSGTGGRARALGREDVAGKTGTTNELRDGWFAGFGGHIVSTAWVGLDQYTSLGRRETGGSTALPIWVDFMGEALKGQPQRRWSQPSGMVSLRIDAETGGRVTSRTQRTIFEAFTPEQLPPELPRDAPGPMADEHTPESIF